MVNNAYNKNGTTMVGGGKYSLTVGSRAQVWNGTAYKTGYGKKGLKRCDLSSYCSQMSVRLNIKLRNHV